MREGDELLYINGVSTGSLSIEEVQDLFRGPEGSLVEVTGLSRARGWDEPNGTHGSTGREEGGEPGAQYIVRLERGAAEEGWESIAAKTEESVLMADGLHRQIDYLYAQLADSQKHAGRLSSALEKTAKLNAKLNAMLARPQVIEHALVMQ